MEWCLPLIFYTVHKVTGRRLSLLWWCLMCYVLDKKRIDTSEMGIN